MIPARGGSKGIPGKNLRTLGGVPLIGRTVIAARSSARAKHVYVSSDNAEILGHRRAVWRQTDSETAGFIDRYRLVGGSPASCPVSPE